ncbi:electron transfer flavoprotein subunit alpha/FixB family protein [Magnetovibrio sp.]|uniref:electron transfer flavoprotein subunit alpha/FixB family protein n=1 Tax=Magnetovibrio sp. TaxID=2024836 RepID=UPI002F92B8A2
MSVLVLAEHDNSELKPQTLNAVAAAKQLCAAAGGDVAVLVVGADCAGVSDAAAKIDGVAKVLVADAPALQNALAENVAPILVQLAGDYSALMAAATTTGKNIMPRAAALLDVQQISDISAVIDADTFKRPIYAGNAIATVKSSDAVKVITVRTTAFEAASAEGGTAAVDTITAVDGPGTSSFVGAELTKSERPELTAASVIISGGRGMASGENFHLLEAVADKLGAAVGASRAAVDAGFAPNDYQVGQTGKVVAPELYIAVGISGAIQHLAGMKDSKVIVAINKDEEAPIFQVADYGLVGDLFDVLPELAQKL